MKIIDGKKLAKDIKDGIVKEILELNKGDKLATQRPNLAIVLIGNREDSRLYVDLKIKEAKKVGIDTHLYECPAETEEQEIIDMIKCLNDDDLIDGILVQLPLPENINTDIVIKSINPQKDVDCFHPDNLKELLSTCNHRHVMSPVFGTVLKMLESINYDLVNKKVVVLANSDIFGESLAKVLECKKAETRVVRLGDDDLIEKTKMADVLITAIGKPKFIKKEMIKKDCVIIDIGITKEDKKVLGDVDFDDVDDKASYISPVPGGVGPMTIALLFQNTLEIYKKRKK